MRKIYGTARYTFIEIFRNKVYYVLLLFFAFLIASSLLLGSLGGDQKPRILLDLGLVSIETIALMVAVFAAVTLVLEEMESRTLYLILTRPVARYEFIVGRFLGLMTLLTLTLVIMGAGHALLLLLQRIPLSAHYGLSLLYSWEKILVITAVAILFSLFSTSTVSAVTFTLFFWVLGHFSNEIRFLAQKSPAPILKVLCDAFYYLAPNFQVLNVRDIDLSLVNNLHWLAPSLGYGAFYTFSCLALSSWLFSKKEF